MNTSENWSLCQEYFVPRINFCVLMKIARANWPEFGVALPDTCESFGPVLTSVRQGRMNIGQALPRGDQSHINVEQRRTSVGPTRTDVRRW